MATTAATLRSEIAAGVSKTRPVFVLKVSPVNKSTGKTETWTFSSGPVVDPPDPERHIEGCIFEHLLNQSVAGRSESKWFGGESKRDAGRISIPHVFVYPGVLGGEPVLNGAATAGDATIGIDNLPANTIIKRGERFRPAGTDWPSWWVVTFDTAVNPSGVASNVPIYPSVPTGGWSDDTRLIQYEGDSPDGSKKSLTSSSLFASFKHYNWLGAAVELYFVGYDQVGEYLPWSSAESIATNMQVVKQPAIDLDSGFSLEVETVARQWDVGPLAPPMEGYELCLYFDGSTNAETDATDPFIPGASVSWTLDLMVFVPRSYISESSTTWIMHNGGIRVGLRNPSSESNRKFQFSVDLDNGGGATTYTAYSAAIEPENWYRVQCFRNASNNTLLVRTRRVGDRSKTITDGAAESTASDPYYSTKGLQFTFGCATGRTAGTFVTCLLSEFSIWSDALTGSEMTQERMDARMMGPISLEAARHSEAAWLSDGAYDSTSDGDLNIWYDQGPTYDSEASPTSNFEVTPYNPGPEDDIPIHPTLMGGQFAVGVTPSIVLGKGINLSPIPAAASGVLEGAFGSYYAIAPAGWPISKISIFSGAALEVQDGLGPAAPELPGRHTELVQFLEDDPTSATWHLYQGNFGSFIQFHTQPNLQITVDAWMSNWKHGVFLNGTDEYIEGHLDHSTVLGGTAATLAFWEYPNAGRNKFTKSSLGNFRLFDNYSSPNGIYLEYNVSANRYEGAIHGQTFQITSQLSAVKNKEYFLKPHHWAIVAWDTDTTHSRRIYLDGVLVLSEDEAGSNLADSGVVPVWGANQSKVSGFADVLFNDIHVDDTAWTAQQVYDRMVSGDYQSTHWYPEPTIDNLEDGTKSLEDQGDAGTLRDLSITADSPYGDPVPIGLLPNILNEVANRGAEIDQSNLDFTRQFLDHNSAASHYLGDPGDLTITWPPVMHSAVVSGGEAPMKALDAVRGPVWIVFDGTNYTMDRPKSAAGESSSEDVPPERITKISPSIESTLPLEVAVGYGRVGVTQSETGSSASETRKSLVATEIKWANAAVEGARDDFPDGPDIVEIPAAYLNEGDAYIEAKRLAQLVVGTEALALEDTNGLQPITPGSIINVKHPNIKGGASNCQVVECEINGEVRKLGLVIS